MKIINPATEEQLADLPSDTKESIEGKYQILRQGQKSWAKTPIGDRIACIEKFGKLISANLDELAKILTSETGKPIKQSLNEIRGAQNRIDHISQYAREWLSPQNIVVNSATNESIRYEPLGVVGNISAWNFPYNVGYNVFLYALVAGNAVLYKPSEYASLTGKQFEKYLHESGIPGNVFLSVIGDGTIGQHLLDSPLDGYFFTGSYKTGLHILNSVVHKMVPVQLELGGKDPLYVMDDVTDIKIAAINAAEGAFYNNGQSCCAVERIYVHEKIFEEFVDEMVKEVQSYKMGDPQQMDTFLGSLTRPQQMAVLDDQVTDALKKGAIQKCGGQAVRGIGYYYQPTVLINVNHDMKIMKEESFGPVIGIQKVSSDEEAIRLMKDTDYGLTSAVFSSDRQRADLVFDEMDTGTVYWNCCDRVSPNVPWSGRKHSGIGSTLSFQGIRAFVKPKAYHLRQP